MSLFHHVWLKRVLQVFLPGLAFLCAFSFWYYQKGAEDALERGVAPVRAWLSFAEVQLAESLQQSGRDATLLAATPGLNQDAGLDALATDFSRFLEARLELTELRLLDMQGNVLLQLERQGHKVIALPGVVADEASRKSVQGMLNVPAGSVRVAALSLEMQGDKVRLPYHPNVLLSTLVPGAYGPSARVLQVRFNGSVLYDRVAFGRPAETLTLWMLEEGGQWLFGGAEKDNWRWQFARSEGKALPARHPDLWTAMQTHSDGMADLPGGFFAYRQLDPINAVTPTDSIQAPVTLLADHQPYLWYLVAPIRTDVRQGWLAGERQETLLVFLAGLVALLAFSVLLGRQLAKHAVLPELEDDSRNFLVQILEKAPMGALLNDRNGQRLYVNQFWQHLTGLSAEEASGQGWRKAIHPDDLERVLASWDRVINHGETVELEYRFLHTDGEVTWARGALLPLRNEEDEVIAYIGVMADITSLKNQESVLLAGRREVERAHEEIDSIFNSSSDPIVGIDMNYCFTIFNSAYANLLARLYGISIQRGSSLLLALEKVPEDRSHLQGLWARALQGERFVIRQTYGDARLERRTFDLSLNPQLDSRGAQHGAVMIMRDVTVAARVEEALLRSEELFRSATESSLDAIVVLETIRDAGESVVDFKVVECNQIALDLLFHRRRQDCMNEALSRIMPSYRNEGLFEHFRKVNESGIPYEEERQVSGTAEWLQYQVVAISDGLTLSVRNITERKAFERRLFENEARIAAILANVQEGIITLNSAGLIRSVNPACSMIFGYSPAEMVGKPFSLLFPQMANSLPNVGLVRALMEDMGVGLETTSTADGVKRDGMLTPLEVSCKPVTLGDESFYTVTLHDIAERQAYEARLQQNIAELELLRENLNETNEQLSSANHELLRLAHLDGLTGLPNRRFFDQTLHMEWMRAVRDRRPIAVIMLDVDHFKRYNDGYGHQAGDECLKLVAGSIQRALRRPADFAARYGGEEFVVILPNTEVEGAELVANVILDDVRNQAIPHANSPTAAWVTVSAGVAFSMLLNAGVDESVLISSADQALYQAKQRGRDRLVVAGRD